jgi:curved DNA-binding protein CbpA
MDAYWILQVAPDCEEEVLHSAYRALARKYHPDRDGTPYAAKRMSDLNLAYAQVRDPRARARHDAARRRGGGEVPIATPVPANVAPPRSAAAGTRLTFGRYAGWTLRDIARQDPDYLRWLSRHSSGVQYRTEIYEILTRQTNVA